ncbi:MAG: dihydrolipoamide acetyltransferase family protein [Chloroflexi bacterium]|nr:dihydrolipoamide acetyltransferase family protein [Chloroflexota bacterium]
MITIIELPQVGESVTEGVIGKWLVEPGQRVEKYAPLVEVVTDKVSMEAPSPYTGVFVRALAEEGETVPMGQPICEMDVDGDESSASVSPAQAGTQGAWAAHVEGSGVGSDGPPDAESEGALTEESDAVPTSEASHEDDPARVGGAWAMPAAQGADAQGAEAPEAGDGEEAAQRFEFMDSVRSVGPTGSGERGEGRPDALQDEALAEHEHVHEQAEPSVAAPDRRHVISPLVARLSAQYGIDLSMLEGTGTGGRITSKDLLEAVNRLSAPAKQESAAEEAAPEEVPGEAAAEATAPGQPAPEDAEAFPLFAGEGEGEGTAEAVVTEAVEQPAPAYEEAPLLLVGEDEGEGTADAVVTEAVEQPPSAYEEAPPLFVREDEGEEISAEAEPEVAAEQPASGEEAEQPAEAAAQPPVQAEPPSPAISAQAGIPGGDHATRAWAAHTEAEEPAEAAAEEEAATEVEAAPETAEEGEAAEDVAPTEPEPAVAETSVLPLTPVRRIIAEHMARSAREIPAAWAMVEADVTRLVRARDALKAAFEQRHGVPLTSLPFAAGAVAAALREHPRLNARWDDGHITLNNRVNLAVAVATDAGLMVPVLHDADTLSIAAIAAELRRLSDGARQGRLGIEDVQGGTFTLNNTGALGSVVSVPIINHPQAAIMTTEAIVKRPVVVEGDAIAVRSMMNLCLTFDHRVCDGADAAAFLSAVKARLEVVDESIGLG